MYVSRGPGCFPVITIALLGTFLISSCAPKTSPITPNAPGGVDEGIPGDPWIPNIPGASAANHDLNVQKSISSLQIDQIPLIGYSDVIDATKYTGENQISIPVNTDLGANGSFELTAVPVGYPTSLQGNALPILVSLKDPSAGGGKEWVPLKSDCNSETLEIWMGSSSGLPQTKCGFSGPSVFANLSHYFNLNISPTGYVNSFVFPSCNWNTGSPACPFNSSFFVNGKLPVGTYKARYVMISDTEPHVPEGTKMSLKVTVTQKRDLTALNPSGNNGAVDLNVIIVGNQNVRDSRTAAGQKNLNLLFSEFHKLYSALGVGVRIGTVHVFEWSGSSGEQYANIDIDLIGNLFAVGSSKIPSAYEGNSVNIFLVSSIPDSGLNGSILGLSGSITGPPINGTGSSGLAFATFNHLATLDTDCSDGGNCIQDMGSTIVHEVGHYLGLFHPNEFYGTRPNGSGVDPIADTPECSTVTIYDSQGKPLGDYVTHSSCLKSLTCKNACPGYAYSSSNPNAGVFCPEALQCQFNHVMWWTSKNYSSSSGDGSLFSAQSSQVINYNPFIW